MNLRRRLIRAVVATVLVVSGAAAYVGPSGVEASAAVRPPLTGHLLALNDFHGALIPAAAFLGMVNGVPAGGGSYLAHYVKQRRALDRASSSAVFTVSAGDIVGDSPFVSGAFHDEPAIEQMNSLGLDVSVAGDSEFDEGLSELRRLQRGGCHPVDGCLDGDGFGGARFPYLAANVVNQKNLPVLLPFTIKFVGKVPIAFVGVSLKTTPDLVNPTGIQKLRFLDEVTTANRYAKVLKALGVKAMVLLAHQGGTQGGPLATIDPDGCADLTGPIAAMVQGLDPAYGIVVTGHTHQAYNCALPNSSGASSVVTSAGAYGTVLTDITFKVDQSTRRFTHASAQNVVVARDPALVDPESESILAKYAAAAGSVLARIVGSITADIPNVAFPPGSSGETPLGDVVADALLSYTQADAGAQIALIGPRQVRSDGLRFDASLNGEAPGEVTYGEAFNVQPFGHFVTTASYTGAQLKEVLEQQFGGYAGQNLDRILQVSQGFTYSYDTTLPLGSRVTDMELNGTPIDPVGSYRVTTNSFNATGGDAFTNLMVGTNRKAAPGFDIDALLSHLAAGPLAPGPADRITRIG